MTPRDVGRPPGLTVLWVLLGLAITALVLALVTGIWLLVADPEEGSGLNHGLSAAAAIGGIGTGVMIGAAALWAQIRGLWEHGPRWVRWGGYTAIAVAIVVAVTAR